jgi:Tol biopolymer transport system component
MLANGTELRNLTNHPASDSRPRWSPAGRKILFNSERDGNLEINVMNADGSNPVNLTRNVALDRPAD